MRRLELAQQRRNATVSVVLARCVVPALLALPACASEGTRHMLPVAEAADPLPDAAAVEAETGFELGAGARADVRVWISEPLAAADERGTVRVVLAIADFGMSHLWVERSIHSGPITAGSTEAIELTTSGVNVGLARSMAAGILGKTEAHPYARTMTGPCRVTIRPLAGRTWGAVSGAGDLEITASMP